MLEVDGQLVKQCLTVGVRKAHLRLRFLMLFALIYVISPALKQRTYDESAS